jgi:anti-sigma regulatory factor (Ser/Thr protein kinase)
MTNGFRIAIGTGPGEVERVTAAFAKFADAHGLPASVRRSLNVALDELLANTTVHGFGGREGGAVTVEAQLYPDRVSVTITDDGKPFDPFGVAAPDTALPLAERPVGGLGLHVVRGLVDEVSYERRSGRNVVVLAMRLSTEGED